MKKYSSFIKITMLNLVLVLSLTLNAQITQPTAWTKAYDQVSGTCNTVSFPIATGSNRILVVYISHIFTGSAVQANPTTITYGGQTLTLATTNSGTSGRMHTWIYYLKDNAVMDNTSRPLNVTLGGTHLNVTVWYGVFAGVNQAPASYTVGNNLNNTAGSGPAQLSAAMAVNTNEQAVYYSCIVNTTTTTVPTYTINANWTSGGTSTGTTTYGWKTQPAKRTIPGANTTDNAVTGTFTPTTCRYAMSAMSLPMAVIVSPTLTISNPTTLIGATSLCGSAIKVPIHAFNIACTGGASTLTNFQFTTTGTYVATDLTNYKIWWNSSNNLGTATLLATNATPGGPGLKTFTAFSLNIPISTTYYFWITADISAMPISGHTITVSGSVSTDMTTTAIKAGGPTLASGTQTINTTPATPGSITGPTSVGAASSGLTYSIAAITGATTYNWTVPTGWSITSGAGTTGITVTSGAIGQNGNITVTASNSCGTSTASTLAVSIVTPHGTCNLCHLNHNAVDGQLTAITGNSNLCMSCHNPTGSASSKPFTNAMKAIPGTSGTSHQWDISAVNIPFAANMPTFNSMLLRLPGNSIICSTCHNQHLSAPASPFLREINNNDALCLNCHTARDVQRYADNPANKGTHPVNTTYPTTDPRFYSSTSLPLGTGKVFCSSCHAVHNSTSTDGNLLRNSSKDALCETCHINNGYNIMLTHKSMTCTTCHYSHKNGSNNIYLVNDNIITPNSGTKPVVFTTNSSANNYGDASGTFNGVCEVCHTATDHYSNTTGGTSDARHVPATQKCINCHPHNQAFYAQTNCFDCHNAVQDKLLVGPVGGRRQIVDNTGNGLGTGGDYKRTSHHVTGSIPNVSDCIKCHYMGDHKRGEVKLLDPDLGYQNIITYDPANKSSVESFCLKCHDSNGANGDVTPFSDNVTVPIVDATMWGASAHKGNVNTNTCMNCHDNGHGSNKSTMLSPWNYAGTGTGTDLMNEEEGFCLTCHGGTGVALIKVHLAFSSYTNTATNYYKHDPTATYRKHDAGETVGSAFAGTNRHVECVDCHNPHGAKAGTATAPTLFPTMIGAKGVEPTYAGAGAPTGFTWLNSVTQEYQVCYKCHSSYTTLPTYLPGGFYKTTFVADGLKKVTTGGTNLQIADSRDMAKEYNPNNLSYHPVMAAGKNLNINGATFQTGFTFTSRIYCSDCHSNSNTGAGYGRGPHGSTNLHLLDNGTGAGTNYNYVSAHGGNSANQYEVCTKCHQVASYYTNDNSSRFQFHNYHTTKEGCFVCHDTHGSENYHLINFSRNEGSFTAVNPNSTSAFNHATGTATNSCVITCHGKGHSTSSKTYNPMYN